MENNHNIFKSGKEIITKKYGYKFLSAHEKKEILVMDEEHVKQKYGEGAVEYKRAILALRRM